MRQVKVMEKTLEDYLGLAYTRELIPEPEGGWFVRIKELPGCMSQGETPEEAMNMINDAMAGWIESALAHGTPIPEPRDHADYSGKFVVRVPKSMHRRLTAAAEMDNVSLNQWILAALAEALGASSKGYSAVGKDLELSSVLSRVLARTNQNQYEQFTKVIREWAEENIYRVDDGADLS